MAKNQVMNYNQCMSAFKSSKNGYDKKANVANKDANGSAKIDQDTTEGPVKGKGTPHIDKYTKQHLNNVKAKKNSSENTHPLQEYHMDLSTQR